MSLPSQDVLDDIRELISEITGFKDGDENFTICERYCLSHVVHHSYPFINRTTVKNLVNSYVSRFYSHGYFKVSQELNLQVKNFLSNEKLFEKNPQYDIQWCLLSLLSSLSSNLTSVKKIPQLLPVDEEENETEDINWNEYLSKDLPLHYPEVLSSDSDKTSDKEEEENESSDDSSSEVSIVLEQETSKSKDKTEILIEEKVYDSIKASELRRKRIEELINNRKSKIDIENDQRIRGNISEKFDLLMSKEGINRKTQYMSEFEVMENILYQFQTGEKIFLRKGLVYPALTSLTQDTLLNYLESLQPYFKIIRSFKDFDMEITEAKFSDQRLEKSFDISEYSSPSISAGPSGKKKKISNVLYVYSVMLRKALEPFQNEVMNIVGNLGEYTLIKMQQKLQPYFFNLTSLFYTHTVAVKNWKKDCNWMTAIRILSVLYNAIMDGTSSKMSFLFLNLFLHCFQVYLDIIDNWISFVDLIDPYDEFIVAKSESSQNSENCFSEYKIRSYKTQLEASGVKNVSILNFIAEKMIHVGQSLEVLRRLGRFAVKDTGFKIEKSKSSSYHLLINRIAEKINVLGKVKSAGTEFKIVPKKKSIFTMKNAKLLLEKDGRGGDYLDIGELLLNEVEKSKEKETKTEPEIRKTDYGRNYSTDYIYSTIRNPYFKMAFDGVGMKALEKKLKVVKEANGEGDESLMVIKCADEKKIGVYPFHKIISESLDFILGNRVSDTCDLVKEIVLKECGLYVHFNLLRSVLLFNDAYLIRPFMHGFFTQPLIWGSSYSLTLHLKECAEVRYNEYASALSVVVAKDSWMDSGNILKAIDAININYEVKWPLTLVFTPDIMMKYNKIFQTILKLKWAHWALSSLYFQSTMNQNDSTLLKQTYHRLQILRFWLLSAFGRINNYFMAQISISMDVELDSCKDLKDIIKVHSDFIEKIYYQCLLSDKSPEGRDLIFQTLIPLCKQLETCWLDGGIISNEKLSSMESTFGNSRLQLSRLMSSLEKK